MILYLQPGHRTSMILCMHTMHEGILCKVCIIILFGMVPTFFFLFDLCGYDHDDDDDGSTSIIFQRALAATPISFPVRRC